MVKWTDNKVRFFVVVVIWLTIIFTYSGAFGQEPTPTPTPEPSATPTATLNDVVDAQSQCNMLVCLGIGVLLFIGFMQRARL